MNGESASSTGSYAGTPRRYSGACVRAESALRAGCRTPAQHRGPPPTAGTPAPKAAGPPQPPHRSRPTAAGPSQYRRPQPVGMQPSRRPILDGMPRTGRRIVSSPKPVRGVKKEVPGAVKHELQAEQEFVDLAYARLDAMRSDANRMLEGVLDLGKGGTFQSRTERDVIVRTSLARLEQLDIGDQALTFGRIDQRRGTDGLAEHADGVNGAAVAAADDGDVEIFHIGRLAVHGADQEPQR